MNERLNKFVKQHDSLIVFLVCELLALAAFGLGNAAFIYRYISLIAVILVVPFLIVACKKSEISSLFLYLIPFIVLVALLSFSKFSLTEYSPVLYISLFFGLLCFFFAGFGLSKIKVAKGQIILLVIGGAIGLVMIISLLYTIFRYGPFYAGIFNNKYYYYNGEIYPVFLEAKWLVAFAFDEVSLSFFGIYSVLLTIPLFALLFISPKKQKKPFYICLGIGLLGLLSIVFIPNKEAALFLVPVAVFALLYRFYPRGNKSFFIGKIVIFALLGIITLFFLVFFLNAAGVPFLNSFTSNNKFLNSVFNTSSFTKPYHDAIYLFTRPEFFFGVNPNEISVIQTKYLVDVSFPYTKSFIFDAGLEGGLFAFIALIVFIVFAVLSFIQYLKKNKSDKYVKFIFGAILIGYFFYEAFCYSETPLVHKGYYQSSFYSLLMLVIVFVLGFTYTPIFMKNKVESEQKCEICKDNKEEASNE